MVAIAAPIPNEHRAATLPTEGMTATLLRDLLGTPVAVKQVTARLPMGPRIALGTYITGDKLAGMMMCDVEFASAAGGLLAMFPPGVMAEAVKKGKLEPALEENWREVANIFASLMNVAGGVHVKFHQHFAPTVKSPPEIANAPARAFARVDFEVTIGNLPKGKVSLLVFDLANP